MEDEQQGEVRSGFVKVRCPDCSNEQVLFWRSNTVVNCQVCGGTLGGRFAHRREGEAQG